MQRAYSTSRSDKDHSRIVQKILPRSGTTSLRCAEHISEELGQWAICWCYRVVSPTAILTLRRTLQVPETPQNTAEELSQTMSSIPTPTSLLQSSSPSITMVAHIILCSCAVLLGLLSLDGGGTFMAVTYHRRGWKRSIPLERRRLQHR